MANPGYEFLPRWKYVTGITNAKNAVVTCDSDHNFSDGEIVSFRVTPPYGMFEMNNLKSRVIEHTSDTITVEIDSSSWNSFIYPASGDNTPPTVIPSASGIIPGQYVPTMNLEDSFDNVRTN